MEQEKVVLVTVVGTSPAVVTETLWALKEERPELLPDEVKIYTTKKGWETFEQKVLNKKRGKSVWEDLQEKVGKEITLRKHVFEDTQGGDLADIVSCTDQELVADQLLRGIREYKNANHETCRLVGSVAGGRKSMSALMYAAMSLGADARDIITHVLVDDKALAFPDFYFSGQEQQHMVSTRGSQTQELRAADVKIELAEIPFVPLATLVKNSDFSTAGTFSKLVQRARQTVVNISSEKTKLRVCTRECKVIINEQPLALKAEEYAMMAIMAKYAQMRKKESPERIPNSKIALQVLQGLNAAGSLPSEAKSGIEQGRLFFRAENWENGYPDNFNKIKSHLKNTLISNGFAEIAEDALSARGSIGFNLVKDIKFIK